MCGIAGFVDRGAMPVDEAQARCAVMIGPLQHRGPDDAGVQVFSSPVVALGHRRLSILELSTAGHQPMFSHDGRLAIVFNGEIYNHLELRSRLQAMSGFSAWRGHADTETLLAAIAHWGVETALRHAVGMFAFALWDAGRRELVLARDRMGEKPLHYGWQGQAFLFGSELKALRAHPSFESRVDSAAAAAFLRRNHVPAPLTLHAGVHKLLPGCCLRLTADDIVHRRLPEPRPYWSLAQVAVAGSEAPFRGGPHDAADELEALLRQAVRLQSVADVPVGAFLSGGVDSSLVVALMAEQQLADLHTFSIGMPQADLDESAFAASVADHLGTRHHAHRVEPQEALALIPRLHEIWDEPLGDSSQIPTWLVSRIASQHVKVALSGDGGDELFFGYPHYALYRRLQQTRALRQLPWRVALGLLSAVAPVPGVRHLVRRGRTVLGAWEQPDAAALHRYWSDLYRRQPVPIAADDTFIPPVLPLLGDTAATAALWDAACYLPDDILVKVDRAAMSNSLETRAPLLDHRVVSFALSLPASLKLHGTQHKRVLKEVLYRHVPRHLVDRPKMGFVVPMAQWLRGELREWAGDLIADARHGGVFDGAVLQQLWQEHQQRRHNHADRIWGLLSLIQFMSGRRQAGRADSVENTVTKGRPDPGASAASPGHRS